MSQENCPLSFYMSHMQIKELLSADMYPAISNRAVFNSQILYLIY